MDVTVNPIPTAAFAKVNACEGESLTFTNKTVPNTANMKWSFGDGTTATSKDATKKYTKAGQYEVTLEADLNGCVASVTQKVYQFTKPVANFDKVAGNCDNDVYEFENKSTINSGLIGSFWNFDDNGSVSTDEHAMYDFSTSGDKKVKLVVTSEFGCKDSITKTISIKESPKVNFTNGPLCSVKPTDFINTTADIANAIANYRWDFGDGNTSGAKSPTHDWKGNLGPKKVTLKVTLDNGCEDMLTKDMVVLTQPKPEFTAGEACSGDEIAFVNNTTWAQGKISYRWDFGDGTTSTNSDPVKVYNATQSFYPNVTLYAFIDGGCGDSITKTNYVLINEKPRTCDFLAEVDYSYGYFGVKVEPMNASGVVGGQNDADYVWVFEGAGTQKTSGSNAAAYNNMPADGEYRITMRATMQQSGCECSATKTIVMNRSAAEQLSKRGVAVYPNPNNGQFQVVTSEAFGTNVEISVLDMNGRVVLVQRDSKVDASGLSAGMYLVRVSNGAEAVTQKIQINY
jgi:PKD repeat protein